MLRPLILTWLLFGLSITAAQRLYAYADPLDTVPRTAVISAFAPELERLLEGLDERRDFSANGVAFATGTLEGQPVVLFLSGVSMTNAAMNTQLVLDRFDVRRILFSGIAGSLDPSLNIGDVVVAERWGNYLEGIYARETAPGEFVPPPFAEPSERAGFGMFVPRDVNVVNAEHPQGERRFWFDADQTLLAEARRLPADLPLRCDAEQQCLNHPPRLVVGGSGVSGPVFMDNAEFRGYAHEAFGASVVDMESAAVAQVAWANQVPFIAFRAVSDLAGGGEEENEMGVFLNLAADSSAKAVRAFMAGLDRP
ncbi:5'-methylthioadenosine/S-adenosylhomocysteine nucleosidase [Halotalea alkalilenta]|uniref:5'-methylthioadenosine/S-adenosylhomocysteine nucleosidase n=1 Tax=Halotalea alkalilenta TaxID=376489 RepID=UPI0009EEDDCA|nr:5'-methylthioadenosine/S-adenosylhomocysteine nucleosidase [Halotalea alkalilenta]